MNEPEWLERLNIIGELESFLGTEDEKVSSGPRQYVLFLLAKGLLMVLREQHERDPSVPPDAR